MVELLDKAVGDVAFKVEEAVEKAIKEHNVQQGKEAKQESRIVKANTTECVE